MPPENGPDSKDTRMCPHGNFPATCKKCNYTTNTEKIVNPAKLGSEKQHELKQVNRENILEGEGMKEIAKVGWEKYREVLTQSSYGEIIDHQMEQIKSLNEETKTGQPLPEYVIYQLNQNARDRAKKLQDFLITNYVDGAGTFVAHANKKKLMVSGNNIKRANNGEATERPVTRLYFTVPTASSPEAFKTLFDYLVDAGVMTETAIALNLENYEDDSLGKAFEDNTIILYIHGKKPGLMEKIAKAVLNAKQGNPEPFKLSANSKAKSKEIMLKNFMIPLDDTTSFVEMPNNNSYHADVRGQLFLDITGEMPHVGLPLDEFAGKVQTWTPQRPGTVDGYPERRRYMPGLLFDKKISNTQPK